MNLKLVAFAAAMALAAGSAEACSFHQAAVGGAPDAVASTDGSQPAALDGSQPAALTDVALADVSIVNHEVTD